MTTLKELELGSKTEQTNAKTTEISIQSKASRKNRRLPKILLSYSLISQQGAKYRGVLRGDPLIERSDPLEILNCKILGGLKKALKKGFFACSCQ